MHTWHLPANPVKPFVLTSVTRPVLLAVFNPRAPHRPDKLLELLRLPLTRPMLSLPELVMVL